MTGVRGTVEVDGGRLAYSRRGAGQVTVLAAHGLTAHCGVWDACVAHLGDTDVIAVDLRGRGASRDLPGPCSIDRHARDLEQLADALGVDRMVVAGHSMGGFVAVALANRRPDLVSALVLVDGGLPFPAPPDVTQTVSRLDETYVSLSDYQAFWRGHPALRGAWSATVERYVAGDLVGHAPELHAACVGERASEDAHDLFATGRGGERLAHLRHPAILLRAGRGLAGEPGGVYPAGHAEAVRERVNLDLEVRTLEAANHFTLLLDDDFAAETATAVADALRLHDVAPGARARR